MAVASVWLIPNPNTLRHVAPAPKDGVVVPEQRKPKMDYLGTFLQTAAIVLLVFGLTEANVKGWNQPTTIATVVIGAVLFPVFYLWFVLSLAGSPLSGPMLTSASCISYRESYIDPRDALLAPQLWRIPNFALLTVFGLSIGFWFVPVSPPHPPLGSIANI